MRLATDAVIGVALCILATGAFHAGLYARAAWRRRPTPAADPCDADDVPRGTQVVRLVVAETVASFWLVLAALRPARLPLGDPAGAQRAILLVAPAWLPARSLTVLGRRLARTDVVVGVARASYRARPASLARVAARADALRHTGATRPLAIVLYGGASVSAERLCALLPRGVPARLVLLAPPLAYRPFDTRRTVTIWGDADPWQTPTSPDGGRPTIALQTVGHLAVLVAPHVADVIGDACTPVDMPPHTPIV